MLDTPVILQCKESEETCENRVKLKPKLILIQKFFIFLLFLFTYYYTMICKEANQGVDAFATKFDIRSKSTRKNNSALSFQLQKPAKSQF